MLNMIDAVFRTKYNDEFKEDFERNRSILLQTVRSDGLMSAGTVKWDVVDPVDAAETRTRDGSIPESQLGLSQVSGTPVEHFKKYRIDNWDAFRGNPNVRAMMSKKARIAMYQAIDQAIIDQLDAGTVAINSGSAISMALLSTFLLWTDTLWSADVQNDGRVWGVVTPHTWNQMMRIEEFKNSRYIPESTQPARPGITNIGYTEWLGVKWVKPHTGLTGKGTATAKNYIYHEDAIGHQIAGEPEVHPYYYEPQDRYECWAKVWHCSKLVLNRGVVRAVADDTAAFS